MSEHSLNDPRLKSLEARLAALAPQLPAPEQQQLLYECGVAAGRRATRGALRRWQASAASLLVVGVAMSIPRASAPQLASEQRLPESAPVEIRLPRFAPAELLAPSRPASPVELDAWQTPQPHSDSLADELAQFEKTDPHLRALAMGIMTRSLLQPESR